MGFAAFASIVIAALLAGIAVQFAQKKMGYDWLLIAVTATFGAYFASETFPGSVTFEYITNFGPQLDGFYIVPGIVTGVVIALLAYIGTRKLETTTSTV